MAVSTAQVDNGVNVEALLDARAALTDAPAAAQFKWRATCEWKNGTHSHSTVEGFYGLGERADSTRRRSAFDADHPEVFASEDLGATPVEYRAGRPRQLPDGRHRGRRPASQDPAAVGHGDDRGRHGPRRASSASTATSATASTASRSPTTSMPTRARKTSRRWSRSRRSARRSTTSSPIRRMSPSR